MKYFYSPEADRTIGVPEPIVEDFLTTWLGRRAQPFQESPTPTNTQGGTMATQGKMIKVPKGAFKKAREEYQSLGEFEDLELEDGRYQARVIAARTVDTKNGAQVVIDIKVPSISNKAKKGLFFSLDEDRMKYLFNTISKLGGEVDGIDSVEALMEVLKEITSEKPWARITVKTKGEYQNYFIDKLLDETEVEEGETSDDDDSSAEDSADSEDEDSEESEEEDSDEETEDEEDDEGEKPVKGKKKKSSKEVDEDTEEDEEESDEDESDSEDDDSEEEEDADEGEEDLDSLGRKALKQIVKDEKLDIEIVKGMRKTTLRELIRKARAGESAEDTEDEDDTEDDEEEEAPKAKKGKGKEVAEEEDEDEEEATTEEETEEVTLKKGMKINATIAGKLVKNCVISEILEEEGKVKVKTPDGKIQKVSPDKLSV